jgi:tetratricopeptide (TPR) repeat protein/O-antigen ligase
LIFSGNALVGPESSSTSSTSRIHSFIPWVLAIVTLAIPFLFRGSLGDPFQLPKMLLFRWGALLILGLWLAGTLSTGRISLPRTGVATPVLLLLFIGLLSVFRAPNPGEASSAVRDMAFCGVVLFLSLDALARGSRIVETALGLSASVTAALGTLQLLLGPRVTFLPPTQGGLVVGDVTTGAMFVAVVLPLLVSRALAPSRGAVFWGVCAGIALGYVTLARSRAAWLGATVGLVVLAALALRRHGSPDGAPAKRRPVSGRSIMVAALLAVALCLTGTYGSGIKLLSDPPSMKIVELQGPDLRLATWRATWRMILSHPLGVGAGSWRRAFPMQAGSLAPDYPFTSSRVPQSAGNEYLETGSELGVAGLILLLWLVARLFISGARMAPRDNPSRMGALACVASAAACGLLASPLREQPVLWGVVVLSALAIAPGSGTASPGRPPLGWEMEPRRRRVIRAFAGVLFVLLLGAAGWETHADWSASASLQRGQAAYFRGRYAAALPELLRASREDPSSSLTHYLAGACALSAGQLDLAKAELTTARHLNPQDASTLLALASTLKAKGRLLEAVGACERARKIWPKDEAVNLALGDYRNAAGDYKGSIKAYRTAIEGNPHSVRAYLKMGNLLESQSQMSGAMSAYSKAVSLDPYSSEGLSRLGSLYMKQGDYESAITTLGNLLSFEPDDVPTLINLARTLAGMQRYCDAAPLLKKARQLDRNPSHWNRLDQALSDLESKCEKSRRPAR